MTKAIHYPIAQPSVNSASEPTALEVEVQTFGCRLNSYESELIRQNAEQQGVKNTIVINSCAVTAEAERQVRQAIRKARRSYPMARIVVTGCAAQIHPESFSAMPEVDLVLGNLEKLQSDALVSKDSPRIQVKDIKGVRETAVHLLKGFEGRVRAFIEVQQGCDHSCTFCIIPQGRGKSRSVPLDQLVEQVRLLVEGGVREIVLTGVDLTSYGGDLPGRPNLGQILRRLLALVPDLPRLRLSSVDPMELDEDVFRLFAEEERLMPHLHLSVQAGDDLILKRMKRRHLRQDVIQLSHRIRSLRSGVVFGADLIAGFPTEDEAMFARTLALVEEADLTYLHVFPYSERPGTPAARMPQVSPVLRKERAARLRALGDLQRARFYESRLGQTASVLIEKVDERGALGLSEHFAPVRISGSLGEIVRVRLTAMENNELRGNVL